MRHRCGWLPSAVLAGGRIAAVPRATTYVAPRAVPRSSGCSWQRGPTSFSRQTTGRRRSWWRRVSGARRSGQTSSEVRGSPGSEEAVKTLLEAGAEINAFNEADFTALHGAAFRGLNEVVQYLVEQGADVDARDFRGRTPFRLAEGSKQSFQFQAFPEKTAELLLQLGANTRLGIPGTVQERADREVAANRQP